MVVWLIFNSIASERCSFIMRSEVAACIGRHGIEKSKEKCRSDEGKVCLKYVYSKLEETDRVKFDKDGVHGRSNEVYSSGFHQKHFICIF